MKDIIVMRSRIHGLGVFAMRPFAPGERIKDIVEQEHLDEPDLPQPPPDAEYRYDYYPGRTVVLPFPDGFFNHSCDPNAVHRWDEDRSRWLVARRSIGAGEEITTDYCINGWGDTVWECTCGAARCRKRVHSSFFELPRPLQEEYLPFLAPWFVEAFPEEVAALRERLAG